MLTIGLCGGTGAGKTKVCEILDGLGFPSINTDTLSRAACNIGSTCLFELAEHFGQDILMADGGLNREVLGKIAFSTKDGAERLNKITHPYIIELMNAEIGKQKEKGASAIFIDAPMLFESGLDKVFDYNIAVIADRQVRIERVAWRSGLEHSDIEVRISRQKDNDFLIKNCDFYIENNGDGEQLYQRVKDVLQKIGLI